MEVAKLQPRLAQSLLLKLCPVGIGQLLVSAEVLHLLIDVVGHEWRIDLGEEGNGEKAEKLRIGLVERYEKRVT